MSKKKISTKNLFFLKSFMKTFALLMLPLAIISAYSLYRFHQDSVQTMEARNRNMIYQIKTQADSMFHTVDLLTDFLSGSASTNNTLQDIFLQETPSALSSKQARALILALQSIVSSNEYSHSCYLYYENAFGRYIATSNGLSYVHNYSDSSWLKSCQDYPSDFWYETKEISTYSLTPDKNVFAIYQKLYSRYSAVLPIGVLVTYFDVDSFQDYINSFILYPDQTILFLQEGKTPLFQTDDKDFSDIWEPLALKLDTTDGYQAFTVKYDGTSYLVSLVPASREGLFYVSLVPRKALAQQTGPLMSAFCLIAAAACILSIFLALLEARKEYAQLQNLINLFNSPDNAVSVNRPISVRSSDPYQIILNNIIHLFLKQNYLKLQLDNKKYQNQLLEFRALQHQINPHFLFNTLNTIYWESIRQTGSPNTCSSMISSLSEIMSYSLTDIHGKVPVQKELEYLQHYTGIQQIRYGNKFEVIYDIDDETLEKPIIKMVLQPLVENSIYHGIKPKDGNGTIKVKLYHQHNRIVVRILDNGIGIPSDMLADLRQQLTSEDQETSAHIGLLNTNRRLILTYGESSVIRLYSRYGRGTIVAFSIPAE